MTAHWGVPDPAAVQGNDDEKRKAFHDAFTLLSTRIRLFLDLPFDKLERRTMERKLREIGKK
jgi:arsenate reductase (thioredoxin)